MRRVVVPTRTQVATVICAAVLAVLPISIALANHGAYSEYYTGYWSSTLDEYGDPVGWTQWTHNYYAHNSASNVQINETSQWVTLDYTARGYENFTFRQNVQNGPGVWYYDDVYSLVLNSGQSENWRNPYYGMWVDKGGGAAHSRTWSYLGEQGVPWMIYHSVDWRNTYVCHFASDIDGSESTC